MRSGIEKGKEEEDKKEKKAVIRLSKLQLKHLLKGSQAVFVEFKHPVRRAIILRDRNVAVPARRNSAADRIRIKSI
jgi:hypothetical protein